MPAEGGGILGRIESFRRDHPRVAGFVTKAAIVLAGLGAGELAMAPSAEAEFHWANVGGAPLVPGGIHSTKQADAFLKSGPGHKALHREGLNGAEINAVEQAVKTEGTHPCTIQYGEHIDSMVSADYSLAKDVVMDDPSHPGGIPGFCVTGVRKFTRNGRVVTEKIDEAIAGPCGNALEVEKHFSSRPTPQHPPRRKPPVPVFGGKVFKDVAGNVIKPFPSGIVEEDLVCTRNGQVKDYPPRKMMQPVEFLGKCDVGTKYTVSETVIVDPSDWVARTPTSVTRTVKPIKNKHQKKRNMVSFLNQEVPQTPPPPGGGTPPKDGTQGPGEGTPGQPGGPGAGGQPGNTGEGAPCYDDASTTNGDLNPATSGDIMYGTPDQFGYCVGPAQPTVNG